MTQKTPLLFAAMEAAEASARLTRNGWHAPAAQVPPWQSWLQTPQLRGSVMRFAVAHASLPPSNPGLVVASAAVLPSVV